jgi:hypothetical protein
MCFILQSICLKSRLLNHKTPYTFISEHTRKVHINKVSYNLRLSWRLNSIKYSRASNRVSWLNGE